MTKKKSRDPAQIRNASAISKKPIFSTPTPGSSVLKAARIAATGEVDGCPATELGDGLALGPDGAWVGWLPPPGLGLEVAGAECAGAGVDPPPERGVVGGAGVRVGVAVACGVGV